MIPPRGSASRKKALQRCRKARALRWISAWLVLAAAGSTGAALAETLPSQTLSWGYNTYGVPGLIEMPVAQSREDAELGTTISHFAGQTRITMTFQMTPRLSGGFRYTILEKRPGSDTRPNDRSFSLHYRFLDEGNILPAMAIGLNDIVGTGLASGEYIVATKSVTPRLRATVGLGWGRLAGVGGFSNPLSIFSDRFDIRPRWSGGSGGSFDAHNWFRGEAAFFGGIEWQASDRLRLIAEYSSDAYPARDYVNLDRNSQLNFGLAWQATDRLTLSASYLYGSELGLQLSYATNPKRSAFGSGRESAPQPVQPAHSAAAATWGEADQSLVTRALQTELAREGMTLQGLRNDGSRLRVSVRNNLYGQPAQALGRTARILSRHAPAEVSEFDITLTHNSVPVTRVTLQRSELEELEFHPVAPDLLRVSTVIRDTRDPLERLPEAWPAFSYALKPYITPSYFDPSSPLRGDVGLALSGRYEPLPGLIFAGRVHQKLFGTLDKSDRVSNSVLPHVRSDSTLYYKDSTLTLPELTASYYFRPGPDLFGRVTAGYLEIMFGGVSTELLWKPQNSALALGIELNYTRQRDFDQHFGFQDYKVATGHLSAYYDFGNDYHAQLDLGRYLAGDTGATLTLAREFHNGWRVAVFATRTDVSAADFGEGSFDKGIQITVPLSWLTGKPDPMNMNSTLRPILRDGGARLNVPGRLYQGVRKMQASEIDSSWARFWK